MSASRDTPPPRLRPQVSPRERAQVAAALGVEPDDPLLRAVRDGRGRDFQRLELLGDSVLDLLLASHRWVESSCRPCSATGAEQVASQGAQPASDRHLAESARAAGLGAWLEWRASDERIADLVETCVAATWLTGGWAAAGAFAARVVHPMGEPTVRLLAVGAQPLPSGRTARRVGASILELAAASALFATHPAADEGELSRRRAEIHRTPAVAGHARRLQPGLPGDDETVASGVEDTLAATLASHGADVALASARPFLGFVDR